MGVLDVKVALVTGASKDIGAGINASRSYLAERCGFLLGRHTLLSTKYDLSVSEIASHK
jgi:NAD(P)-dependent dehydrogenase (short-subunit alcohol dehydrogenase family)